MRQKQKLKAPSQSINESVVSTKNQSGQDLPQEKLLIKDKSGIGDDLRSYQDGLIDNLEEGYEEITGDIEARMAELFQEQLAGRPIVTIKDVNKFGIIIT